MQCYCDPIKVAAFFGQVDLQFTNKNQHTKTSRLADFQHFIRGTKFTEKTANQNKQIFGL
jgi:hypothetical protein